MHKGDFLIWSLWTAFSILRCKMWRTWIWIQSKRKEKNTSNLIREYFFHSHTTRSLCIFFVFLSVMFWPYHLYRRMHSVEGWLIINWRESERKPPLPIPENVFWKWKKSSKAQKVSTMFLLGAEKHLHWATISTCYVTQSKKYHVLVCWPPTVSLGHICDLFAQILEYRTFSSFWGMFFSWGWYASVDRIFIQKHLYNDVSLIHSLRIEIYQMTGTMTCE